MRQLQGEAMTLDLVREGLGREVDKVRVWCEDVRVWCEDVRV